MNPEAITGCILGTAVGDALGLSFEGLSPKRSARLFRDKTRYHFLFSKGMVSDDTEHTCIVAQSLIASAGAPEKFARELSRRFRFWLLGLPAGVGFATLRSILKLWVGFPPTKSGVFSAGNGPAMRCAIIGVCYGDDDEKLKALVRSATVISHTDPKAYFGALAVAVAAHMDATSSLVEGTAFSSRLEHLLSHENAGEFLTLVNNAVQSAEREGTTEEFLQSQNLGNGISGYIYHTVPAVIHAWLVNTGDFRKALIDIITCGGHTEKRRDSSE
ncbi:MAG: ADP-ribosylglycohydrolase family protein, partial [Deltaproteobacteria bacterium]|nr:ADP-ribosylglycohydrolase family protein [Deltaproteobacteria bacterium]